MDKPFIFGSATLGKWFTDREEETKRLKLNFTCGVNTIIISPRRWGKTSLVLKASNELNDKNIKVVNMDIFACRSIQEFYQIFATELIKQTSSKWEEWVENAKRFLANLSPKITFGSDPMTEFSLSLDFNHKQFNEELLALPQKIAADKNIKIVVCIDEFQQVAEFSNSLSFQKKLRSVWQLQAQNVTYCLYGSKKHLLSGLFSKTNMPFYKFGDILFLQKIAAEYWITYICERFEQTGKQISQALAEKICKQVENHSAYVQQLAWLVWIRTDKTATQQGLDEALQDLISQNSMLYHNYLEGLTSLQLNFLKAVANGIHTHFSKKEVLTQYKLGTSANISRIKKALEDRELIDIAPNRITFNDTVFRLWFIKEVL